NASCSMSNVAKIQAYNETQSSVSQSITQIGMFAMIFVVLLIVVVIGGIIFVILFGRGAVGNAYSGNPNSLPDDLDAGTVNQLLSSTGQLNLPGGRRGGIVNQGTRA